MNVIIDKEEESPLPPEQYSSALYFSSAQMLKAEDESKTKSMKPLGILLIAVGILMIVITGFNLTTREKVLDVGPVHVSKEEHHPINWSPIAGAAIAVGGIVVLLFIRKEVRTA